jgi:hypothetical protein
LPSPRPGLALVLAAALAVAGCATQPVATTRAEPKIEPGAVLRASALDPQLEARILALDPAHVSDDDVRKVLALGPTPRIVGVHGGVYGTHLLMESFARFLVAMGYQEAKTRHPGDGRRSHSPYEPSERIAGVIAWYYEREGMMPMMIGHSQGGIQAVKVLHELAGTYSREIRVHNPISDSPEDRVTIVDPLTGLERPVVGLRLGYVSVVGAGGAALMLPNQWNMANQLRAIPDTVDEFTGFSLGVDLIAWDLPGAGTAYRANGAASVRNVELPADYSHVTVVATAKLARDPAMREWINAYVPGSAASFPANAQSTDNALWAADVWYSVKKHWVIEAQRFVRARRELAAR